MEEDQEKSYDIAYNNGSIKKPNLMKNKIYILDKLESDKHVAFFLPIKICKLLNLYINIIVDNFSNTNLT